MSSCMNVGTDPEVGTVFFSAYWMAYALAGLVTLNQAAYRAGRNSSVSAVATTRPPMMATAIGPQNTERDSGIIASAAAAAVSTIGRQRRTAASMTASHGSVPVA